MRELAANTPTSFFVYGTLKRGQCREACWPVRPQQIRVAYAQGELYNLGDYPAMVAGNDTIVGELWSFPESDIPTTLQVLDEIEGYRDRSDDLYQRVVIACRADSPAGVSVSAHTYFYQYPLQPSWRITGEPCFWPSAS